MKKIILIAILYCCFYSAYSNNLIEEIHESTLEHERPKYKRNITLSDSISNEKTDHSNEYLQRKKILDSLILHRDNLRKEMKEIKKIKKENAQLKSNKTNINRLLQKKKDSLITTINELNEIIKDKDKTILQEQQRNTNDIIAAKEEGKKEILRIIIESYKNNSFDDLINKSTLFSIQNDLYIFDNNAEIQPILLDLEKYFNAKELLSKKYDFNEIENAQKQLNEIEKNSKFVEHLKEHLSSYKGCNDELKNIIEDLIHHDETNQTAGVEYLHELKFKNTISKLRSYIYKYYNNDSYPYLSEIVLEIITKKWDNGDAELNDLLKKIQ